MHIHQSDESISAGWWIFINRKLLICLWRWCVLIHLELYSHWSYLVLPAYNYRVFCLEMAVSLLSMSCSCWSSKSLLIFQQCCGIINIKIPLLLCISVCYKHIITFTIFNGVSTFFYNGESPQLSTESHYELFHTNILDRL